MHTAAWCALRAACSLKRRPACRVKASIRPLQLRNFHSSLRTFRAPEESSGTGGGENEKKGENDTLSEVKGRSSLDGEAADCVDNTQKSTHVSLRSSRRQRDGSGTWRENRNKSVTGLPPLVLPDWFWERNVTCFGDPQDFRRWVDVGSSAQSRELHQLLDANAFLGPLPGNPSEKTLLLRTLFLRTVELEISAADILRKEASSILKDTMMAKSEAQETAPIMEREYSSAEKISDFSWKETSFERLERLLAATKTTERLLADPKYWYTIDESIYAEIYASFAAELQLSPPNVNIKDVNRQDTLLMYLDNGGLRYVDAVVQSVATLLEADVIRLDAEDLAQIIGEYLGEDAAWKQSPIAMLGYNQLSKSMSSNASDLKNNDVQDTFNSELNNKLQDRGLSPLFHTKRKSSAIETKIEFLLPISEISEQLDLTKVMKFSDPLKYNTPSNHFTAHATGPNENWNAHKTSQAMDVIIDAADVKRTRKALRMDADGQVPSDIPLLGSKGLIIQISGYNELNDHPVGYNLLNSLRDAVKRHWYGGKSIMIVGTATGTFKSVHLPHSDVERVSSDKAPSEIASETYRTIHLIPGNFTARIRDDQRDEIRELNIRHVEHMIKKLLGTGNEPHGAFDIDRSWWTSLWTDVQSEVLAEIWSYDWVRKVALTMLGITGRNRLPEGSTFEHALHLLRKSDRKKISWANGEFVDEMKAVISSIKGEENSDKLEEEETDPEKVLEKFNAEYTAREKRLLGGMINPSDIHTTFADIRAPSNTVEALKTLTSLSLIRPDSFSYGVLASDKIPGVLLYGPPGTGKTLLAKAVAKECGAKMLEVSASEINNMYIGEGEKNVKALFSLAKKLAPCVVFIDEADSLFASRGGVFQGKSHRNVINQFLREWDGMANLSAFIMVATNRPFDLDEAVLRRLPRRLLVDLPMEEDRAAILKIHLKDEILDESVSLTNLAKETPFYSGSDLKNLSVAAALACVREENEMAAKNAGGEPYVYPPKRVLRKEHFDKAMEEISASISEDMSTLRAIRKFDETYGDRKGRPKRQGMGFGGRTGPEPDSGAGRVRKQ